MVGLPTGDCLITIVGALKHIEGDGSSDTWVPACERILRSLIMP